MRIHCLSTLATMMAIIQRPVVAFIGKRNLSTFVKLSAAPRIMAPEGFQAPEPKPLQVADGNYVGALTGSLALAVRLGAGTTVVGWTLSPKTKVDWPGTLGVIKDGSDLLADCKRPTKPIIIYEYEASPFCRKVREACSMLDLTVEYRPCPGARTGWSNSLASVADGRRTVPFMIDKGSSDKTIAAKGMFESDDIIEYLFENCK